MKEQVIYIIYNPITKYHKIGISRNIKARISHLSNSSGVKLELVYTTPPYSNASFIEHYTHVQFKENRLVGEWFSIDPNEVIKFLKETEANIADINEIADIYKKYANGVSTAFLAKELGITRQAVHKKLSQWGAVKSDKKTKQKEYIIVKKKIKNKAKAKTKPALQKYIEYSNSMAGATRIKQFLYKKNDLFIIQKMVSKSLLRYKFKTIEEAEQCLNEI